MPEAELALSTHGEPMHQPMTARAPVVYLHDLRPSPTVDDELDWFFNRAECDMGATSNYQAALRGCTPHQPKRTPEDAAEAAHRYRHVRTWLKAIPDADAGVLEAAYELRAWPIELFDELGRLTGIVARLACALDYLPPDRATQRVFELARAEALVLSHQPLRSDPFVVKLRRDAELRFARASRAYSLARGARAEGGRS